ncbi:unnamed protein product [Closterium sp. Naga37s-1]|nr:unnamed protein product [Closterium sp. Naga37s-1]
MSCDRCEGLDEEGDGRIPLPRARLLSSAHSLAAASPLRADCCATPPSAARVPPYRRRVWRAAAAGGEAVAGASPLVTAAGDSAVAPAVAVRNLVAQAQYAQLCSIMPRSHHRRKGYPFGSLVDFTTDAGGRESTRGRVGGKGESKMGIWGREKRGEPRIPVVPLGNALAQPAVRPALHRTRADPTFSCHSPHPPHPTCPPPNPSVPPRPRLPAVPSGHALAQPPVRPACTVVVQIPPPPGGAALATPTCTWNPPSYPYFPCHSLPPPTPDPVFLLSTLGMHSCNLQSDPRCTVVVQIPGWSGLADAHATIFGDHYPLPPTQQVGYEWARGFYVKRHQHGAHECSLHHASITALHLPPFPPFFTTPPHLTTGRSGRGAFSDVYFVGDFGMVAWIGVAEYVRPFFNQ